MAPLYIGISIIVLTIVVVCLLVSREKTKQLHKLSNLAVLGMSLVVLGIIFSDDRWIGYSLIGFGVLLSVIDGLRSFVKSKWHSN
jgi:phosphatidylserine synthase